MSKPLEPTPMSAFSGDRSVPGSRRSPRRGSRHLPLISACFAVQAPLDEPFTPICAPRLPYGANMAMRRHRFKDLSFDTSLGPVGATNYQDEETVLLQTLLDRGLQGLWVKDARVQHFIPKARLTEQYVWRFHCCNGRTRVLRDEVGRGKEIFSVPRWILREYREKLAICKLWSPTKNERWLQSLKQAAICWGIISEIREQRRASRVDVRQPFRNDEAAICR